MLANGDRIDRYVIEEFLGAGASAAIYRARHVELNTQHALKLLRLAHQPIADKLLQEGRIQAKLRHPNVVTVTDMVRSGSHLALIMDLVDGISLGALANARRLTAPQIDAVAAGLFDGLEAAHEAGLVHRDLKPDNVMMQFGDRKLTARITDFGLAKGRPNGVRATLHTQTGSVMGTPLYMAPEQYVDPASVDASADIYSLGAILYELVTGQPLYAERDFEALQDKVRQGDWTPVFERAPDVDPNWEQAINTCLALSVEDRAGTIDGVRNLWKPLPTKALWSDEDLEDLRGLQKRQRAELTRGRVSPTLTGHPAGRLQPSEPTEGQRVVAAGLGAGAIVGGILGGLMAFLLIASFAYRSFGTSPTPDRPPASAQLPDGLDGYLLGQDETRHPLTKAPPGSYVLYVFFDPEAATEAGTLDLHAAEVAMLRCDHTMRVCTRATR